MTTTLRDLIRFVMPPGSRLLTAVDGLHAHVRAVVGLRATLPAFPELHGGEVTLVSPAQALALDERLTLPHIVRRLAEVPVTGIAVTGLIDEEAVVVARQSELALIALPADADLRAIERDAARLMRDADLQIERWAAQLYSDLTQRVIDGAGIAGVLRRISEWTELSAAFYSTAGTLRAEAAQGAGRAVFELLRPAGAGERHVLGWHVFVEQVGEAGWLAVAGPELDHWDHLVARQGASALALELAKEQAVKNAEARVRGDVLRTILSGAPADSESLSSQAAELGYQLNRPHIALVIAPIPGTTPAELQSTLERLLAQRKLVAPVLSREDSVGVFVPDVSGGATAGELIEALRSAHRCTVGVGGTAPTAGAWPRILDEAEQALALGRQLFGPETVTAFADLGVYRFLLAQRESPELWRFYRDTLGPILDHGSTATDLLETLEGYFVARGNVSRAAAMLHIHRNTLIYRLQRICEIAGVDWERAEDQLALQLALKAHRVLRVANQDPQST